MIKLPSEQVKETPIFKNMVRYAEVPSDKSLDNDTAIFFIAGQKSPLERFYPMAQYFSQYYRTYAYEIPGMGTTIRNPESTATIESLGEEIALFIDKIVKEPKVIIIAASAGFWFSTQAILSEEKIKIRVKKIVSIVGLLGKDTFGFSKAKRAIVLAMCWFSLSKIGAKLIKRCLSNERFLNFYAKYLIKRRQLDEMTPEVRIEYEEFEKFLLRVSDWDIHFSTVAQYLTTETPTNVLLDIPVFALYSENDQFFPYANQKKTFGKVYKNIMWDKIMLKGHAPLVVKGINEYKDVIPEKKILEFLTSMS